MGHLSEGTGGDFTSAAEFPDTQDLRPEGVQPSGSPLLPDHEYIFQNKEVIEAHGIGKIFPAFEIMSEAEGSASSRPAGNILLLGHKQQHGPTGISFVKRTYMVVMFCATASLLYADQNLMAPNLTAIAEDFKFNDDQRDKFLGGYIAAGFYMVGAPAALLFGYLSDTVNRRNLLFVAVLLGEGPCILTFFVTHYWQLLVLRLLTGISLGGTFPLVFSLLGDLVEPSKRAAVAAAVQLAMGVGLALGQGISGFVGSSIGWRWPFVIVAVPSIALATVMLLTTEEPPRGATEQALQGQYKDGEGFVYDEKITWTKLRHMLCIPTNVLAILQGLFGCLPWGMLLTFLNDFLSQNKGLSVPTATAIILVVGFGGAVGVIGGGLLGQLFYNRRKHSMPIFIGVCTLMGTPPLWVLINAPVDRMIGLAFVMAFLTGVMSSTVGPNLRAMMLNVNEPETRGMALALQTMLDDLGKGLGPALVALLISSMGRTSAFNISAAGWIPCGLLLLLTAFTLQRDEDHMQHRLQHVVSQMILSRQQSSAAMSTEGVNANAFTLIESDEETAELIRPDDKSTTNIAAKDPGHRILSVFQESSWANASGLAD